MLSFINSGCKYTTLIVQTLYNYHALNLESKLWHLVVVCWNSPTRISLLISCPLSYRVCSRGGGFPGVDIDMGQMKRNFMLCLYPLSLSPVVRVSNCSHSVTWSPAGLLIESWWASLMVRVSTLTAEGASWYQHICSDRLCVHVRPTEHTFEQRYN